MNHRLVLKSAMFGAEACALLVLLWIAIHALIVRLSARDRHVWRSSFGRDLLRVPNRPPTLEMERAHNLPGDACHGQEYSAVKGKAVHMNSGSFDGGLLNLTNWIGNAVMPILAALILATRHLQILARLPH